MVAGSRVRSERSDAETRPLIAALAERGVDAADAPWDDDTVDWAGADLVAVRTTWDYTERRDAFLAWAARVDAATRLVNPRAVLEWNSHKRYLVELAEAGVPTVPTTLLDAGTRPPELRGTVVVKPAVSAGGRGTYLGRAEDLHDTVAGLLAAGDVLVQPAVESIGRDGEVSLIRLGDTWSHAVRKLPAAGGFLVHEKYGGALADHTPTTREVEVAEAALARAPAADLAAARVDLVRLDGEPVVMELELIEPELFLRRAPDAPARLADALLGRLW
ncbi:ATP-grasp domain-containing protein [Actinomycetospora sp. C-140]